MWCKNKKCSTQDTNPWTIASKAEILSIRALCVAPVMSIDVKYVLELFWNWGGRLSPMQRLVYWQKKIIIEIKNFTFSDISLNLRTIIFIFGVQKRQYHKCTEMEWNINGKGLKQAIVFLYKKWTIPLFFKPWFKPGFKLLKGTSWPCL